MSTFTDRAASRLPEGRDPGLALVPAPIAARYAAALASLPRTRLALRRATAGRDLPAVGSFG